MKSIDGMRIIGIIGYPLGHSLSPLMHNRAFEHLGLHYQYTLFPVKEEELGHAIRGIRALNIVGCNVTIPYKEQVIPFLDYLAPGAKTLGAVNTIVNKDGELWGYNTDGIGFYRSLTEELGTDVQGKKALLIGAGGAARAVAHALLEAGLQELVIANRNLDNGKRLANELEKRGYQVQVVELKEEILRKFLMQMDFLINSSSVGMYPQIEAGLPIKQEWLRPPLILCDLIYNPVKTKLLQMGEAQGCQILNGVGMLVYQGAAAFELWTGQEAPVEIMKKSVLEFLAEES